MTDFPSKDILDNCVTGSMDTIIKWTDLQMPVWYKIESMSKKETKFGQRTVLQLSNREGVSFSVWAPELLSSRIKENPKLNFVQAKGLVTSKQNCLENITTSV